MNSIQCVAWKRLSRARVGHDLLVKILVVLQQQGGFMKDYKADEP